MTRYEILTEGMTAVGLRTWKKVISNRDLYGVSKNG